jgi:hypothetical protein
MLGQKEVSFLSSKAQSNPFFKSLLNQWETKNRLSDKQIICITRAMSKEGLIKGADLNTFKNGALITISKTIANKKAEEFNMAYFFRNLVVVETHRETFKAVQLTVKFQSDITTTCHICGRNLSCEVSKATGIGPVCAEKLGFKRPTLKDSVKILQSVEKLVKQVGDIGPLWIPKYSIKNT